jgi:hypothetical protein
MTEARLVLDEIFRSSTSKMLNRINQVVLILSLDDSAYFCSKLWTITPYSVNGNLLDLGRLEG